MIQEKKCIACQTKIVSEKTTETRVVTKRVHPCGKTDMEIKRFFYAQNHKSFPAFHIAAMHTIENAREAFQNLERDCPLKCHD